mgnify:CR=1 FL=1
MVQNKAKENKLILIPKTEKYMEYMLQIRKIQYRNRI